MRFNSVFGAIAFIFCSSVLAMLVFVQTQSFGHLLTKVVSDVGQRHANIKVGIKNVEFSFLPPGLELHKVSVSKKFDDGKSLEAELGKIGFYLNLIEIEERRLAFGEIKVSEAVVDYDYPKNDEPPPTEIKQEIIDQVFAYSERLPVRVDTVIFENTKIHANHDLLDVRRLKLFKDHDVFVMRTHVTNIKPLDDDDFTLDEVWADAEVGRRNIVIQKLKLQYDVHSVVLKGTINDYPMLKAAEAEVAGEGLVYLKALRGMDLPGPIEVKSGNAQVDFKLKMKGGKFEGESEVGIKDLKSNFASADVIRGKVTLKNDGVHLSDVNFSYKDQKVWLLEPVRIAQLDRKEYLREPIKAQVSNLKFSNALKILGPAFKPLRGNLNGRISFRYRDGDFYFVPANGFSVSDLALVTGKKEKPFQVVRVKEARLTDADIAVIKDEFQISSIFELPDSKFELDGYVGKGKAKFSVIDGKVNLRDFGDIAKLGGSGKGTLSADVEGPLDDIDMNFKGKMAGFAVLGYELGNSDLDLGLSLKHSTVTVRKFDSSYGKTVLSGNGVINYGNGDIALGINSPVGNYRDLSQIMKPLFSKITFLPPDFDLNSNIDAYIHGKTSLDKLKVKSHVKFTDLVGYGENVNRGSFDVGLINENFSLSNFDAVKDKGSIEGNYSLHMPTQKMTLKFRWDSLSMASFNLTKKLGLNLDGVLMGNVQGEGKTTDYLLNLKNEITDTKSQNYRYKDSSWTLKIMPNRVIGDVSLFDDVIDMEFDYSMNDGRKSSVSLDVDMPDLKPYAVAFLGPHLDGEDFEGKLGLTVNSSFNRGFTHLDLSANLRRLTFVHETFNVDYKSERPEFVVTDSRLVNWGLNISQQDLYVMTKGTGTFGKELSIVNEIHVNSKIAELLFAEILSAEGFVRNIIRIDGHGNDFRMTATSKSDNLSLTVEGAPFPLNEIKYSVDYTNNRLVVRDFQTSLESGTIGFKGDVYFSGGTPDVNIKYSLNRAEIPFLGKSSMNATGEGIILGNELPYSVGGEIVINKGQVSNELNDFGGKTVAQVRYLPKNQESVLGKLFNLNLNVKAENPIRITNSLMDVALKGEMRLAGNPARPRGEGRMYAPVNTSRIFFKNSEYFIQNADINFSLKKEITNPDFDVSALTYIASYKVTAKAYGDLERFNFDLTSDPALPRNSILSLIAFGYTDEIQSQLTQGQQQNLTQVGVGSFVFDRFKISDILNKQFGLQVNLGTVFEQSQTQSMLSGRSQDGQGTLGRTRSATKIELKKRLDEALTLSVSSTMGGSIGQRQSMNLTYSVNKKVQLEGIYELRTNAEGEEDVIDNSIGGDLKFRWTFK